LTQTLDDLLEQFRLFQEKSIDRMWFVARRAAPFRRLEFN